MINKETLLSLFDDRPTLMKWLRRVEEALKHAALSDVSIQQTGNDAVLLFSFDDGTTIESSALRLPHGASVDSLRVTSSELLDGSRRVWLYYTIEGEQERAAGNFLVERGQGIKDVTIDENNKLIATLDSGRQIETGRIAAGQLYEHQVMLSCSGAFTAANIVMPFYDTNPNPYTTQDIDDGKLDGLHAVMGELEANGTKYPVVQVEFTTQGGSNAADFYDADDYARTCKVVVTLDKVRPAALAALKGEKGEKGDKGQDAELLYRHSFEFVVNDNVPITLEIISTHSNAFLSMGQLTEYRNTIISPSNRGTIFGAQFDLIYLIDLNATPIAIRIFNTTNGRYDYSTNIRFFRDSVSILG